MEAASTAPDVAHSPPRQFRFNRKSFDDHYDIQSTDGEHLLYVGMRLSGLSLHDGPDSKSPIVAESHMPTFSHEFMIGLGDPHQPLLMRWEEMTKMGSKTSGCSWAMTLSEGEKPGARMRGLSPWMVTSSH
jgi:hypothetical protein